MNPFTNAWKPVAASIALGLALAGCGRSDHGDHAGEGGHGHQPKNGGHLIEVGQHEFNLEVLRDAAAGRLTVWLLDAHAENYVRVAATQLDLEVTAGGTLRNLSLQAVANAATGEKVGDTSQFDGTADWLKGAGSLSVRVPKLSLRGKAFDGLSFEFPPRDDHSHH